MGQLQAAAAAALLLCHWHSLTHSLWVADSYAFHTDKALKFCARFVLYFEVHFHKLPALPTLYIVNACVWLCTHCQVVACLGWVQV